jgi:hypothetical protein
MATGSSTFSNAGGAASDLFAGFAATSSANLKAQGLNIDAEGNIIKAQGDLAEGQNYDLAASLAEQNKQFTIQSTAIKELQIQRQTSQTIGGQQADVAGAGFGSGGSAAFLLADSAAQGRLAQSVAEKQGQITEASYDEQAQSYNTLSAAAKTAAGEEETIAGQTQNLAQETIAAGKTSATGDFISSALKGAAAVASIALAPATGGVSLAVGGLFTGSAAQAGLY